MATSFIVTLTTVTGFTFVGTPNVTTFAGTVIFNNPTGSSFPVTFTVRSTTTANVTVVANIPGGSYNIDVDALQTNILNPTPPNNSIAVRFVVVFNPGSQTSTQGTISRNGSMMSSFNSPGIPATIIVICLHGSSLVQMRNGLKRIDQIKAGDEVLSGTNLDEYAKVDDVAQCWLTFQGVDHDAIIFKAGSLGDNQLLIIDPGHPMCTREEYLEKGYEALRPAGTFWEEFKGDKIIAKKWTDVFVQNEPSVRYDLILEEPFNTYVASGLVVRSRGYRDHRYKDFV